MKNILNKKILLVICGGIAAYKSLELIRILKKNKCKIKTILTKGAMEFITPLSISSLSGGKVYTELFDIENEAEMDHISLSRWADIILFAPATANKIAQLSNGLAQDLATTVALASDKEIYIAPAMNVRMWENNVTKTNLKKLVNSNFKIIGPDIGEMACGEYGAGKFLEPAKILNIINDDFKNLDENRKFKAIVTAGPTREYIDPVRFISNRSSGKQGYAIANQLQKNGFKTLLISGPTNLEPPIGVEVINVNSSNEMYEKTVENLPVDVAIFAAAVADFKPEIFNEGKVKKDGIEKLELNLVKNDDILELIKDSKCIKIGFAAETSNHDEFGVNKLNSKDLDMIVINDVSNAQIGFESDYNQVKIITKKGDIFKSDIENKKIIASNIVDKLKTIIN